MSGAGPAILHDFGELAGKLRAQPTVVIHSAFAEPQQLVRRLAENAAHFTGATLYSLMPMAEPAYVTADAADDLDLVTFFPGTGLRRAVNRGLAHIQRRSLSQIPALFGQHGTAVDLLLLQVSPPDADGQVSLGISVDYMPSVLARNPIVVAQINRYMPHTCGATRIALQDIDYCIERDESLVALSNSRTDDSDRSVARHVAGLVEDGDVLQTGIGSLPDLVLDNLNHLKHLGGHSGIVTDAWRPLIESGVLDNSRKKRFRGVTVTTMAGGKQPFYDFLHRNPAIEFHPCTLTHGHEFLSGIDRLCAINSVLQIDLAGNANAESANGRVIAAPGGLPDFAGGASHAPGGKSIVALRSGFTTREGERLSNIVARLDPALPVTLQRSDIDFVVTEYGVAALRGLTAAEQARALIAIAHPEHHDMLRSQMVAS